ncbi:MAG: hypothetical protein U1C04_14955, partial [Hydrogenophaga sp.]|nr:hypothetical protein [Hydrogenophaga sp.]
ATLAALATPQGQVALQALLFNPASVVSGGAGATANAALQYAQTGEIDLRQVGVSALTGMVAGGGARLITEGTRLPSALGHTVAVTGVVGVNAAGAAVTQGEQGPTAAGSVAGYGAGLIPNPWGALVGAFAQELVTRSLSATPPSSATQRPTRGGQ